MKVFNLQHIEQMDKLFRTNFINCLSGFKSLNLVGTISTNGQTNLAPISSIIHVGAHPPLMGMLLRPHTTPRHTLENIKEMKCWTLNHVHKGIYQNAHQASARYKKDESEFHKVNLTEEYGTRLKAPYVKESHIKIGLELEESFFLNCNNTNLIIGRVQEVILPEGVILKDGFIDVEKSGTLTVSGLDSYHKTELVERLPYAKR